MKTKSIEIWKAKTRYYECIFCKYPVVYKNRLCKACTLFLRDGRFLPKK